MEQVPNLAEMLKIVHFLILRCAWKHLLFRGKSSSLDHFWGTVPVERSSLALVQLPEADLGPLFDLVLAFYDDPYRRQVLTDLLERGGASGRASWLGQLVLAD